MKKMIALLLALAALLGCTACGQKEEAPHGGTRCGGNAGHLRAVHYGLLLP